MRPLADHLQHLMADAASVSGVGQAAAEALAELMLLVESVKQQQTGIGSDLSAVKSGADFSVGVEWQTALAYCFVHGHILFVGGLS